MYVKLLYSEIIIKMQLISSLPHYYILETTNDVYEDSEDAQT